MVSYLEASIFLILHLVAITRADFEQRCTFSDYYGRRVNRRKLNRCGRYLVDYVYNKCGGRINIGGDGGYTRGYHRFKRDILLTRNEANTLLRPKRSSNGGIVCECCIHDCTVHEFDQYCQRSRSKRSVKDLFVPPSDNQKSFTAQEVKEMYHDIDNPEKVPEIEITSEIFIKMQTIEEIKRLNIEKKHRKVNDDQIKDQDTTVAPLSIGETGSRHKKHHRRIDAIIDNPKGAHIRRHLRHKSRLSRLAI